MLRLFSLPGRRGCILTQGHGTIGDHACEPLVMLKHFGPNHPEKP